MFGQSPKPAFFLSQRLLNIFRNLPPSFKYNITFDEKKFSQRKDKMLPKILFLQLSKAAKPTDLNAAKRDSLFYFPPTSIGFFLTDWSTWKQLVADKESVWIHCSIGRRRILSAKLLWTFLLKKEHFRTVLNCFVKGNSPKESRCFIFHFFLEISWKTNYWTWNTFLQLRTKQIFFNDLTKQLFDFFETKKKRFRLEEKKAQKLKILRRLWDLR